MLCYSSWPRKGDTHSNCAILWYPWNPLFTWNCQFNIILCHSSFIPTSPRCQSFHGSLRIANITTLMWIWRYITLFSIEWYLIIAESDHGQPPLPHTIAWAYPPWLLYWRKAQARLTPYCKTTSGAAYSTTPHNHDYCFGMGNSFQWRETLTIQLT